MGNLYLIRHGQASFGAEDYDVLSAVGVRQSQALGEHLAQLGVRLDRCVAGDLRRQQDTARLALEALHASGCAVPAVETDAAFNEFDADGVIHALLPGLMEHEPNALHILRNGAQHRSEFQRLFAKVTQHDIDSIGALQQVQRLRGISGVQPLGHPQVLQPVDERINLRTLLVNNQDAGRIHRP